MSELEYLSLLKLKPEKPTLDFLGRLVQQHQRLFFQVVGLSWVRFKFAGLLD